MKTRSIRFKTSVFYSSILCVILVCFSFYIFHMVQKIDYEEVGEDLKVKAQQIEVFLNAYASISLKDNSATSRIKQFLFSNGEGVSPKEIINQLWKDSQSLGLRKDFYRILSPKGLAILRSENMTDEVEVVFNAQFLSHNDTIHFTKLQFKGSSFYAINYPFKFSNNNVFVIQLATPLTSIQRILSKLEFFIIGGIVTILLITLFMGTFLTRRILRSVTDVTMAANKISQKNLNMRIPKQKLDHEMEELIDSFNGMIERLERSFTHVNEFSSHVAHELKTPLAIIKNELELALNVENSKEENQRVMTVVLKEVDRLIKVIKDLLLLAKFEYNLNVFKMEEMDLTAFIKDVYQHCKVLAAEKGINLKLMISEQPVRIKGDAVHLRRIFFNLVHNAVKFTPPNGDICILSETHDNKHFISVKDTGIGIAPTDQTRIFERFYRIRHVDQEDTGGNGLGLCMARTIARTHGGDITFKSEINKGSTFTVFLPISPD